jgi:hypothetical protein
MGGAPAACSEDQRQHSVHHQQPDQKDDVDHATTSTAINAAAKKLMRIKAELKARAAHAAPHHGSRSAALPHNLLAVIDLEP